MAVPQSDLYSLGVILYEMLTGKVPFDDQSAMSVALQHLSDAPPPLRRYRPEIKPELEAMVLRALEKEPGNRYPDCTAMVAALEEVLGMTDEDETTREIVLPDWAKDPDKLSATVSAMREAGKVDKSTLPVAVVATPDDETLDDKPPKSAPASAAPAAASMLRGHARGLMIGGAALMGVAMVVLVLAAMGGSGTPDNGAAATPTAGDAGVALAATDTDVPTDPPAPTATSVTRAPTVTTEATATATTRPATATTAPTVSDTVVTARVTTAPAASGNAGSVDAGQVLLIYDEDTLVLLNQSDEPVDVSDISFVQPVDEGRDLTFATLRWADGSAPTDALPAGDCFQVWTTQVTEQPVPAQCGVRHKWDQASFPRWFWISDSPDAVFEVRRGTTVLAECPVADGECVLDVG
jgi:serine/threonine-protein kinase